MHRILAIDWNQFHYISSLFSQIVAKKMDLPPPSRELHRKPGQPIGLQTPDTLREYGIMRFTLILID